MCKTCDEMRGGVLRKHQNLSHMSEPYPWYGKLKSDKIIDDDYYEIDGRLIDENQFKEFLSSSSFIFTCITDTCVTYVKKEGCNNNSTFDYAAIGAGMGQFQ